MNLHVQNPPLAELPSHIGAAMHGMTAANLQTALRWAGLGAKVFPCHPNKNPLVLWQELATTDEDTIRDWWAKHPFAIPAISTDNLLVIDADRKGGIDGVAAFVEFCTTERIGTSGAMRVRTPSGGEHFIFRTGEATGIGNKTGRLPKGIDVRSDGKGYIIAPGTLRDDGSRYEVIAGPSPEAMQDFGEISLAPAPLLRALAEPRPAQASRSVQPSVAAISAPRYARVDAASEPKQFDAATSLSNTPVSPRFQAVDQPIEGIDLTDVVASTGEMSEAEMRLVRGRAVLALMASDIAALPPGSRNTDLFQAACRAGGYVAAKFMEVDDVHANLFAASVQNGLAAEDGEQKVRGTIERGLAAGIKRPRALAERAATVAEPTPNSNRSKAGFKPQTVWTPWNKADERQTQRWLIKNVLPRTGVGSLIAPASSGKSALALALACHIISGTVVFGNIVKRPGAVLWVAGEGISEMHPRLLAAHTRGLIPETGPFHYKSDLPQLLPGNGFDQMRTAVRAGVQEVRDLYRRETSMIVLDTASALAGWNEENANGEISRFYRNLQIIAAEFDVFILVLDHISKNTNSERLETWTARGGSSKTGDTDVVLAIKLDEDKSGRVSINKTRSSTTGIVGAYRLHAIDIGVDEDGEIETAVCAEILAAVSSTTPSNVMLKAPTDRIKRIISAVEIVKRSGEPLNRESLRKADSEAGHSKDTFRHALADAVKHGHLPDEYLLREMDLSDLCACELVPDENPET